MKTKMDVYWTKNLRRIAILLEIWTLVGYVFSIFLVVLAGSRWGSCLSSKDQYLSSSPSLLCIAG